MPSLAAGGVLPRADAICGGSDRRLLTRFLALAGALALFYLLDWTWLQAATRAAAAFALAALGHDVTVLDRGGTLFLVMDSGHLFAVRSACTYVDLLLAAAPFLWRFGLSLAANASRIAVLAGAVGVLNLARVSLALHLYEQGTAWLLCHSMPDILIHTLVLSVTVLTASKADRAAPGPRRSATATGRASRMRWAS